MTICTNCTGFLDFGLGESLIFLRKAHFFPSLIEFSLSGEKNRNVIIHYLPLIFNYATFYHAFLADKDMSPVTRPPQRTWHVLLVASLSIALLVVYSATHDTKKVRYLIFLFFENGLVLIVTIIFFTGVSQ